MRSRNQINSSKRYEEFNQNINVNGLELLLEVLLDIRDLLQDKEEVKETPPGDCNYGCDGNKHTCGRYAPPIPEKLSTYGLDNTEDMKLIIAYRNGTHDEFVEAQLDCTTLTLKGHASKMIDHWNKFVQGIYKIDNYNAVNLEDVICIRVTN